MIYSKKNILNGAVIYCIGDTAAALFQHEFSIYRMMGMLIIGGTIYAFEIPNYFQWIDRKTSQLNGIKLSMAKTALATVYFNPLWIARHFLLINLVSLQFDDINMKLLSVAWMSFIVNIPISFIANYLIQNVVKLDYRFVASAIFSGLMAIYYAMSISWFG